MKPGRAARAASLWALLGVLLVGGCGYMPVLEPAGPGARGIANLWWILFFMTAIPATIVILLLLVAVRKGRRRAGDTSGQPPPASHQHAYIIWGGAVIPAVILVTLLFFTFRVGREVAHPPRPAALTVELTGHQFWWEVRYPDHDVVTANEIHLPAGEVAHFVLRSADVIHSFWVPPLHGKIDMVPGHVNHFWLEPEEPGIYRGFCAEFCGAQHALMQLLVIAQPEDEFAAWVERTRQPAAMPEDPPAVRGQEVFVQAACNQCHTVRGMFELRVTGVVGPDLTHVASRRTLAAAVMPNTTDNLRQWVRDPHVRKPGNRMPATPLEPKDLDALLAFLQTLR
jgi:cytochrome c oxidase subunit II